MNFGRWTLFLLIFSVFSCSHVTIEYRAHDFRYNGDMKTVVFRKSYENKNSGLCYLTAIFLGGACWFHTIYPTVGQKKIFLNDFEKKINQEMPSAQYQINSEQINQIGWSEEREVLEVK